LRAAARDRQPDKENLSTDTAVRAGDKRNEFLHFGNNNRFLTDLFYCVVDFKLGPKGDAVGFVDSRDN
jgi:hypothetical protein